MSVSFPSFEYLIGAIDNNGSFIITQVKRHDSTVNNLRLRWNHHFVFRSVDPNVCFFLEERFGGNVGKEQRPGRIKSLVLYSWRVTGDALEKFCSEVYPHLFVLKKECGLLMELRQTHRIVAPYCKITDDIINKRRDIYNRFIKLREDAFDNLPCL